MKHTLSQISISILVSALLLAGYHIVFRTSNTENMEVKTVENNSLQDTHISLVNHQMPIATEAMPSNFTEAAERSMPAVVHIKSVKKAGYKSYDSFFDLFGMRPRQGGGREMVSTGSGVIISEDGYIVTNNHVIADGDRLEVTLYDNRSYMATVIGTDPSTDLGLIRIEEQGLPIVKLSNSDKVRVGEWVLAVGNPFNLASTATAGIVSAIGRDLKIIKDRAAIESFIQTDAAVNPGNSGGALVNLQGELVGINTAIASPTGAYAGYAFAVPANIVGKVIGDLKKYGSVQRGYLGVYEVVNLDSKVAEQLDVNVSEGVYIQSLSPEGAAEKAGMKIEDIIIEIDGIAVKNDSRLKELVGRNRPGDRVDITVLRKNKRKTFVAKLTNSEGTTNILGHKRNELLNELGAEFSDLSSRELQLLAQYNISGGAKVSKLYAGKMRQHTDMKQGFIILQINETRVKDAAELTRILELSAGTELEITGIYPGSTRYYSYSISL